MRKIIVLGILLLACFGVEQFVSAIAPQHDWSRATVLLYVAGVLLFFGKYVTSSGRIPKLIIGCIAILVVGSFVQAMLILSGSKVKISFVVGLFVGVLLAVGGPLQDMIRRFFPNRDN